MKRGSAALLGGITLLGTLLRVWSPGRIGLWGDEVQFLNVSALPSYGAIVEFLYAHESHPPLFYFMAHAAGILTGNAEGVVATITLTASIVLIPAAWWLASLSGVRGAGTVAASLVAASVPLAALSVQLRPYSILSLLLIVSAGAIVRAGEGRPRWNMLWAASMVGLLYFHHLGVLILAVEVAAIFWLAVHDAEPGSAMKSWAPWLLAVTLLAIPDLLLLLHQQEVTGYLPSSVTRPLLPFRQLAWLSLQFPGELLLPMVASGVVLLRRRSVTADEVGIHPRRLVVLGGMFLLLLLMLAIAAYRQSVLVEHIVLPFAPLGLVIAGIVIARAFGERRRWAAFAWSQAAVVCVVLSGTFTVGWYKTQLDLMARYVSAESAPGDLVILFPGSFGAALDRSLRKPLFQISFPVIGAVKTYRFDHHLARIRDPGRLETALDSIESAASTGRRVWMISPSKWLADSGTGSELPDPRASEAAAFRRQAAFLRRRLMQRFGSPSVRISSAEPSWSMEVLTLELFAPSQSGG